MVLIVSSKYASRYTTSRDKSNRRDALVVGFLSEEIIERFSPHFTVLEVGKDIHFGWLNRIYSAVPVENKHYAWWRHVQHMALHEEVHFLV